MGKILPENRGINKALFNAICSTSEGSPFWETMGFQLIYLAEGKSGIRMSAQPKFSSILRRLPGGILATLADSAMSLAYSTLGGSCRTVDISLNFLAPVPEETGIIAEGYVVNAGKTLIISEGSIFNDQGRLIARSRGTFIRDSKYQPYEDIS